MNGELLNYFLRPDALVIEWGSNQLCKSLFSEIDSRRCKIDSYNWLRNVNAEYLSTQCVSHSGLSFFFK